MLTICQELVFKTLHILTNLIIITTLGNRYYFHHHFIDEKNEAKGV